MIFLDDRNLKDKVLYKKKFYLPINKDDKRRGSMAFLLSPNFESSVNILSNDLMDIKYYSGYYIEKNIIYYINQENATLYSDLDPVNESYNINYSIPTYMREDYQINDNYMRCKVDGKDMIVLFPESTEVYTEANSANNPVLKRILWDERYKTPKDVLKVYSEVESEFKRRNIEIDKMYLNLKRYRQFNLFVDLSFYNETFFKNNMWKLDRGINLYFDFITRFLKDSRFLANGYTKSTIIVPVNGWSSKSKNGDFKIYTNDINPISMLLRLMNKDIELVKKEWEGFNFLFLGNKAYFKLSIDELQKKDLPKIKTLINKLIVNDVKDAQDVPDSKDAIKADIINKIEKSQNIELKSLTGDNSSISKAELVDKVDNAVAVSDSEDEALEKLDDDEFKKLVMQLGSQNSEININATRTARMEKLNNDILDKEVKNRSIRELISYEQVEQLPVTKLNIDSINHEWENLTYTNFDKAYDIDADIAKILQFFSTRSLPVSMRNIKVEDTSSSEDWVYTYTVECEDYNGQRFTLKFDIPIFKDNRYMYLRGNEKILNGQLMQLPISKTDQDTVQIVSNYNKIFIRRFGSQLGKSNVVSDRIVKTINKMKEEKDTTLKVVHGDNRKICSKYNLPYDYIDLSSDFSRIETKNVILYFNQDEIRKLYTIDEKQGIPIGYNKTLKKVIYSRNDKMLSMDIYEILSLDNPKFNEVFEQTNESTKYCYSKASVLGVEIPVILIISYHIGLLEAMNRAEIKYTIEKPRTKYNHFTHDVIKFKDGWIIYELNDNSSLLMNGMKECDTLNYSIAEIGDKDMYLDFLDSFGGRIKADGLDNFYDLMVDPITLDVIKIYKLPEDYISLLIYANKLLEDNKYIKHTDLSGKRYRTNEIIAGLLYNELAASYGQYKIKSKRVSKGVTMSIKQSAVIDALLLLKTSSDASILNALLDVESMNAVSFKGLSGMNADRAYDLDKRTYDESMINKLALSTGFAGNVGITRQTTIDMDISGSRGIISSKDSSDDIGLNTLCMTEAVTPYSVNHDDPFRSAMTYIQTSKHFMRTETMSPRLITNGADEALPYMASNTFAYKAKQPGKVIEKTDDYMILEYKDGTNEYVNLESKIVKNSSGGFFGSIKLDTNLKEGSTFKANEIVAYDKSSFSDSVGPTDNIAYNSGTLVKMAVIYTDEGIEDSGIITEWLSEALASEVVIKIEAYLDKSTNVYDIVKVGQHVEEGDPLITFQEATDDEDINLLMKALGSEEDEISTLGRVIKKSKYTGDISDIKIYRTVEINELSESLQKIVKSYEKNIANKKAIMKTYDINETYTLDANYKLPPTGKLKNVPHGVLIEFYIRFFDKFKIGDKDVLDAALKNTVKDIIPKGEEPYSEFRPEEEISTLASLSSIEGRMVSSIINNGCLNKIIIELDRAVKEKLGIPWKPINELK